jgi:hypothetical protein
MAGDEARVYWEAVAARDWETVEKMAQAAVARMRHEADELEERGKWLASTSMRLEAREIERGELAPFPKQPEAHDDDAPSLNLPLPRGGGRQ